MAKLRMIPFKISGMDGLGQGVSKETDKITFIPKTLPGETGEAEVLAEKKGVAFAAMAQLREPSPRRITPVCPHFSQCPSCHYLHANYDDELSFKQAALERLFFKIPHPPIKVSGAPKRVGYRNRIQLHYDARKKLLGMLDAKNHSIAPIPGCLIASPLVTEALKNLYQSEQWLEQIKTQPAQGHVEIYERNGLAQLSWNRPYAEGGFTQVFEEMNQLMKNRIGNWAQSLPIFSVLDLFAGNGNISDKLNYSNRLCVDNYSKTPEGDFLSQDLYAEDALKKVQRHWKAKGDQTCLILDPPRSGLKNLNQWLEALEPQFVVYVSCDPNTLARDLAGVSNYVIDGLELLDFFPSTFHYETLVFLSRK